MCGEEIIAILTLEQQQRIGLQLCWKIKCGYGPLLKLNLGKGACGNGSSMNIHAFGV